MSVNQWGETTPFEPEDVPVAICRTVPLTLEDTQRIKGEEARGVPLWYSLGIPTVPSTELGNGLQYLVEHLEQIAPELIEPTPAEEMFRFALRRLMQMADNKAATVSMAAELCFVYQSGIRAGYTCSMIREYTMPILAKWRDPQARSHPVK